MHEGLQWLNTFHSGSSLKYQCFVSVEIHNQILHLCTKTVWFPSYTQSELYNHPPAVNSHHLGVHLILIHSTVQFYSHSNQYVAAKSYKFTKSFQATKFPQSWEKAEK